MTLTVHSTSRSTRDARAHDMPVSPYALSVGRLRLPTSAFTNKVISTTQATVRQSLLVRDLPSCCFRCSSGHLRLFTSEKPAAGVDPAEVLTADKCEPYTVNQCRALVGLVRTLFN